MNISIIDKRRFYEYLKELGYHGLDVSFDYFTAKEHMLSAAYTDEIQARYQKITDSGLTVCQTHLSYFSGTMIPIGDGTYAAFEDYMLPLLKRQIELTAQMNCKVCVLHPYFEEDREKTLAGNLQLISKLLPVAEQNKVVLAIENVYLGYFREAHISTTEDFMFYIDHFKNPYLGICLDTGHTIVLKQNPVAMFRELKDHIAALHLHTTWDGTDMHMLPYAMGCYEKIDWNAFYQEMLHSNYSGTFNLEVSPDDKLSDEAKKAYYLLAYETVKSIMKNAEVTI